MLTFLLTAFSIIGCLGAFVFSVVIAGLVGNLLTDPPALAQFLVYIECVAAISVTAALILPCPNFVYDGFFVVCWAVASVFSVVEMASSKFPISHQRTNTGHSSSIRNATDSQKSGLAPSTRQQPC